jgi:hypothetical protein
MGNRFWADSRLEPKRQHRWLLFIGGQAKIPAFVIKKVDKPKLTVNSTEHKYFGHSFFYPGHVTWDQTQVTLVDPIHPDASKKLYDAIRGAGYRAPTDREGVAPHTMSKAKATNYLSVIKLQQMGPDNEVIETWNLFNPWILDASWGSLDYDSDGMVELTVTFRYDYATFKKG